MRAVEALGHIGDPQAMPILVDALNDPRHEVRMEAAWALDRLGWVPQSNLQRVDYLIAKGRWSELATPSPPSSGRSRSITRACASVRRKRCAGWGSPR